MSSKTIDYLNIGLMLFACVLAFLLPFELFLFSYAVLGPLHYLTEITWLHKRDYFATSKFDYVWLVLISVLLFLFSYLFTDVPNAASICILVSFALGLGFVIFDVFIYKLLVGFLSLGLALVIQKTPFFFFTFGIFLPTLIHVFLFTGLFILFGALKSKSILGILSIVVFALCAISFFVYTPEFSFYHLSDFVKSRFDKSGFALVNQAILYILKLGEPSPNTVFHTSIGLGVMRFIAFAYTYHYLNWFSKTSVIKWHEVPKNWLISVVVLWVISVGLYAYDYGTGLVALYFLSMMHVLLEFPLNFRSIIGIGNEVKSILQGKANA